MAAALLHPGDPWICEFTDGTVSKAPNYRGFSEVTCYHYAGVMSTKRPEKSKAGIQNNWWSVSLCLSTCGRHSQIRGWDICWKWWWNQLIIQLPLLIFELSLFSLPLFLTRSYSWDSLKSWQEDFPACKTCLLFLGWFLTALCAVVYSLLIFI